MNVTESDIKKLSILYKTILNKRISISNNNIDKYNSKLKNLKVKFLKKETWILFIIYFIVTFTVSK